MLLSMAFVFSYFNMVCAKPLFLEMPFLRSQVANQHSQGEDSQPLGEAFEPERNISQESDITSDGDGFLEILTMHNRTTRSTHPCVSVVKKEYDSCRGIRVEKVECEGRHPACNHVIPIHKRPLCVTVYGYKDSRFVTKCPSLPLDCKCAD